MNQRKIQYHHRAKQSSIDKTQSQILSISPILPKPKEETVPSYFLNKNIVTIFLIIRTKNKKLTTITSVLDILYSLLMKKTTLII